MSKKIDALIRCIILLFKEYKLLESNNISKQDISIELVNSIITIIKKKNYTLGGEVAILTDLVGFIDILIQKNYIFSEKDFLLSVEITLRDHKNLLKIISKYIETETTITGLKNSISNIKRYLLKFYKENEMNTIISKAHYDLVENKVSDINIMVSNLIDKLQSLCIPTATKDPAIQEMVDIDNEGDVEKYMSEVAKEEEGGEKFITGWRSLNKMLQGGFRRSEEWVISSLQHNYKSGFVRSLFTQLITLNKPIATPKHKKPLAMFISFEDQILIINSFIYKYLYHNEFGAPPEFNTNNIKYITDYIKKKLTSNGFKVMILKVDPSQWSYKNIINKVIELEAEGYDPQIMVIDYLSKINTEGCKQGPIGTDYRDLFDKMRQFAIGHNILLITPHQLSTEAKNLNSPTKGGLTGFEFLREINGRGYYADTRQLDQVVDGEIYIIKSRVARGEYKLFCARGKHRSTKVLVNENDLEFSLPFPKNGMPILSDIDKEDYGESENIELFF